MSHAPGHLDSSSLLPSDELTHVGRYELIMPLGKGGMAHVYLARNVGSAGFQRLAAIKVMHRNLAANDEFVEMFLDEARVAACIHHPNVVPIIDLGIEGDQLYMVMDYVEGDTLAAVQRTAISLGRMIPIGIVLRMALDALAGLEAAHNLLGPDGQPLNVIHRDVSPQNILVGSDGASRLVDFGIARAEGRIGLTSAGILKGKAPFMAPEQLEGRPIDRRADVFSMGVTLWETLALRRCLPSRAQRDFMHRSFKAPYRPLRAFVATIPAELDAICARALAYLPQERFLSAAEFADAIEQSFRADIATHREVGQFMQAVAADKISRERESIRAASAHPSNSDVQPIRSSGEVRSRGRRDSAVNRVLRALTPAAIRESQAAQQVLAEGIYPERIETNEFIPPLSEHPSALPTSPERHGMRMNRRPPAYEMPEEDTSVAPTSRRRDDDSRPTTRPPAQTLPMTQAVSPRQVAPPQRPPTMTGGRTAHGVGMSQESQFHNTRIERMRTMAGNGAPTARATTPALGSPVNRNASPAAASIPHAVSEVAGPRTHRENAGRNFEAASAPRSTFAFGDASRAMAPRDSIESSLFAHTQVGAVPPPPSEQMLDPLADVETSQFMSARGAPAAIARAEPVRPEPVRPEPARAEPMRIEAAPTPVQRPEPQHVEATTTPPPLDLDLDLDDEEGKDEPVTRPAPPLADPTKDAKLDEALIQNSDLAWNIPSTISFPPMADEPEGPPTIDPKLLEMPHDKSGSAMTPPSSMALDLGDESDSRRLPKTFVQPPTPVLSSKVQRVWLALMLIAVVSVALWSMVQR